MARVENLEFLTDVVPRTTTYKQYKQKQTKDSGSNGLAPGQTTLDGSEQATNGADHEDMMDDVEIVEAKPMAEPNGSQPGTSAAHANGMVQ